MYPSMNHILTYSQTKTYPGKTATHILRNSLILEELYIHFTSNRGMLVESYKCSPVNSIFN